MVEYWVSLGKNKAYYYFKRSRNKTTPVGKAEFDRVGLGVHAKYSVEISHSGQYSFYKTRTGRKIPVEEQEFVEQADYLPNLKYVVGKLSTDLHLFNYSLPPQYVLTHIIRAPVTISMPQVIVKSNTHTFQAASSIESLCDKKYTQEPAIYKQIIPRQEYEKASRYCFDNRCQNIVTRMIDLEPGQLEAIKKLSGNVLPTLLKHWKCNDQHYFMHEILSGGTLTYAKSKQPMDDSRKNILLAKLVVLLQTAHKLNIALCHSITPDNIGIEGDFGGDYEVKLLALSSFYSGSNHSDQIGHIITDFESIRKFLNDPITSTSEPEPKP
jgi:hypothetical protein